MKIILALSLAIVACTPAIAPVPTRAPVQLSSDPCPDAYARAVANACTPVPPKSGITWTALCRSSRAEGSTFGVGCVMLATSRAGVQACGIDCE